MISFKVAVATRKGLSAEFEFPDTGSAATRDSNGIGLSLDGNFPCRVAITPPPGDLIRSISYVVSCKLKNYHQVIVPDTGRGYPGELQLVNFWARNFQSRVNNIRMPLFILTGANLYSDLAFGVIGQNYESDFIVREPAKERALVAWMKRLTLEIKRGTGDYPIPDFVAKASPDGSITEYVYFREAFSDKLEPWIATLRDFSNRLAEHLGVQPVTTEDSLQPYWCSWTDWDSNDVTDKVILQNVKEGLKLGIKNFIIDDGWFGPGLDSDFSINLNIGDWQEDPKKIPDLKSLVKQIRRLGANSVIWCAPHAVAPHSKAFSANRQYLIQNKPGELLLTYNKFHSFCFMCPQARQRMAELCVDLIRRYDVDGAKYDLFNCIPSDPCVSADHEHDTTSQIEGLHKTLELIAAETRALKNDYIIELKQNYGTPYLYKYGTTVRAGDTPYNAEGNYLRTAYVNAYTPFSLNDYQTITNADSPAEAACLIAKMIAVGPPTYSINLPALEGRPKDIIAFYNRWYQANLGALENWREPLDANLGAWLVKGRQTDIYFLVNGENRLNLPPGRNCQIVNGTFCPELLLKLPRQASFELLRESFDQKHPPQEYTDVSMAQVPVRPGDIVTIEFIR